jgi:hypothetical protein
VMAGLIRQHKEGMQHRLFGKEIHGHVAVRRSTAVPVLRQSGWRPDRRSPHYFVFVLGESAWFRGLGVGMCEVRLPMTALPYDKTSATYPDSFTATEVASEFGLPHELRPYVWPDLPRG